MSFLLVWALCTRQLECEGYQEEDHGDWTYAPLASSSPPVLQQFQRRYVLFYVRDILLKTKLIELLVSSSLWSTRTRVTTLGYYAPHFTALGPTTSVGDLQ